MIITLLKILIISLICQVILWVLGIIFEVEVPFISYVMIGATAGISGWYMDNDGD